MARELVDSGCKYLGMIPSTCKVNKFKYYLLRRDKKNMGDCEVLSLYREYGIVIKNSRDDNHNVTSEDTSKYKYVRINDFVVNKMKAWQGSVAVSDYEGIVSPAYYVYEFIDNSFIPKYFHYLLRSAYKNEFRRLSGGIREGQWDLSTNALENIMVLLPSLPEQQIIANFLDDKCAEIDTLIVDIQREIDKLERLKRSMIAEAVTKGLDKNVELIESGVTWIGKTPRDWDIMAFRFILNERNEKNIPIKTDERLSLSIDIGITLYAEKTTNLDRFKEDVSQYKIAHIGDLVLNSMNVIVGAEGVSKYFGCISPAYYTYYDNDENHYDARFCDYVFKCKRLRNLLFTLGKGIMAIERGDGRVNTCRLKVSRDDIGHLKFPFPSKEERIQIVDYLDARCAEFDTILSEKQKQIEILQKLKRSVIYEYVTGKKEVK